MSKAQFSGRLHDGLNQVDIVCVTLLRLSVVQSKGIRAFVY